MGSTEESKFLPVNQIMIGDCIRNLQLLPESSVDLVVTSPPYNCGKDYGVFDDNMKWDEYWEFTSHWLSGCYRVVQDGGRMCVNLPWWMGKKPRRDVVSKFKQVAINSGWMFLDKITWIKGSENNQHTSGGYGGGGYGWGTYMSPSGPAIRCASEPILVFAKGTRGRGRTTGEGRGKCVKGDMTKDEWMKWTIDVWHIPGASSKKHPAIFPDEIPRRLIGLYTWKDDLVLDPFCGIGTTCRVAEEMGRRFIGIELNPEFAKVQFN